MNRRKGPVKKGLLAHIGRQIDIRQLLLQSLQPVLGVSIRVKRTCTDNRGRIFVLVSEFCAVRLITHEHQVGNRCDVVDGLVVVVGVVARAIRSEHGDRVLVP